MLLERLSQYRFGPSRSPEWGSGGIFGLRYHGGYLYFMLSMDAKAYFVSKDHAKIYGLDLVGKPPRSGGDTYNASDAIDNKIFFGGWVHAPISITHDRRIDFSNKYSHIHVFNIDEQEVRLLWSETGGYRDTWVGEVSNILYDPINQRLLVSRADGNTNLGVYSVTLDGRSERLSDRPSLKGTLLWDLACFDVSMGFEGFRGIQCLDLVEGRWFQRIPEDLSRISVDGGSVTKAGVGVMASMYNRIFVFVRGGLVIWEPWEKEGEDLYFLRLFDFPSKDYGPLRTSHTHLGGGILVPFNTYPHGILRASDEKLLEIARKLNSPPAPTLLTYISPPTIRILCPLGARVTSLESLGDKIVLGTNTQPNLGGGDMNYLDTGDRSLLILSTDTLMRGCGGSIAISMRGIDIGTARWGGVPVSSLSEASLTIYTSKDNELRVYEYEASLPPKMLSVEKHLVRSGKNTLDLKVYRGIVSFELSEMDGGAKIHMDLIP